MRPIPKCQDKERSYKAHKYCNRIGILDDMHIHVAEIHRARARNNAYQFNCIFPNRGYTILTPGRCYEEDMTEFDDEISYLRALMQGMEEVEQVKKKEQLSGVAF